MERCKEGCVEPMGTELYIILGLYNTMYSV